MSDETSRVPKIDAEQSANGSILQTVERLERKIDTIGEKLEAEELDRDGREKLEQRAEKHKSSLDDEVQRRDLRKLVVWLALAVIFFMLVLIGLEIYLALFGGQEQVPGSVRIALFVSPIVSSSTITIFLLIGAFRGFKEKDVNTLPMEEVGRELVRILAGR